MDTSATLNPSASIGWRSSFIATLPFPRFSSGLGWSFSLCNASQS